MSTVDYREAVLTDTQNSISNKSKREKCKELAVKKALEEADKGEFISHEEMRAWFASLCEGNELHMLEPDLLTKASA